LEAKVESDGGIFVVLGVKTYNGLARGLLGQDGTAGDGAV
jgi:hypothetical protein